MCYKLFFFYKQLNMKFLSEKMNFCSYGYYFSKNRIMEQIVLKLEKLFKNKLIRNKFLRVHGENLYSNICFIL